MATPGGGSQLTALAQKRRQIDKTRAALSIGQGTDRGAPQASAQPAAPPPPNPIAAPPVPSTNGPVAAPVVPGAGTKHDPKMLAQVKDFLDNAANQGNAVAPPEAGVQMAPPTVPPSLPDQVSGAGAANYSPEMQFMRLAGRPPSGREMVVFNTTAQLTQQLGRAPTRNEVLTSLNRAQNMTQGPEPVM